MTIIENTFQFAAGIETLTASIDALEGVATSPDILSLHGAGPHNRNRISYLTKYLATFGHVSLRFDFSGHPDSTGEMGESSLEKRYNEALAASSYLGSNIETGCTLIGTSMGGHISLELLSTIRVKNLILFCPAAYSQKAFNKRFSEGFSEIIRQKDSYRDANVFEKLITFTGNVLIIIGDDDKIIPGEVLEMYNQHSRNASKKKIIKIPLAPHAIHVWLEKNPSYQELVCREVREFINN